MFYHVQINYHVRTNGLASLAMRITIQEEEAGLSFPLFSFPSCQFGGLNGNSLAVGATLR